MSCAERVVYGTVFVVFMDEVRIGKSVLKHLDKAFPSGSRPAIDAVAEAAYQFYPCFSGKCDLFICGLMEDGCSRLIQVRFHYNKDKGAPRLTQDLKLAYKEREHAIAIGAGKDQANGYLRSVRERKDVNKIKKGVCLALLEAATINHDTGGYLTVVHIINDENGQKKCETTKMKVIQSMSENFES